MKFLRNFLSNYRFFSQLIYIRILICLIGDLFIGSSNETFASIAVDAHKRVLEKEVGNSVPAQELYNRMLLECKRLLLRCATADSLVRLSTPAMKLLEISEAKELYREEKGRDNLLSCLSTLLAKRSKLPAAGGDATQARDLFMQITTFDRLLSSTDKESLARMLDRSPDSIQSCYLHEFDTQLNFQQQINRFLELDSEDASSATASQPLKQARPSAQPQQEQKPRVLLVQCARKEQNAELIACAQMVAVDCYKRMRRDLAARASEELDFDTSLTTASINKRFDKHR